MLRGGESQPIAFERRDCGFRAVISCGRTFLHFVSIRWRAQVITSHHLLTSIRRDAINDNDQVPWGGSICWSFNYFLFYACFNIGKCEDRSGICWYPILTITDRKDAPGIKVRSLVKMNGQGSCAVVIVACRERATHA